MAAITSNTICAPITSHNTGGGSLPELTRDFMFNFNRKEGEKKHSGLCFADKLHDITEKLHNLSHFRSDSDCGSRSRSGTCKKMKLVLFNFTFWIFFIQGALLFIL